VRQKSIPHTTLVGGNKDVTTIDDPGGSILAYRIL